MEKSKTYYSVKFSAEKLKEAISKLLEKCSNIKGKVYITERKISFDDETWRYDSDEEFYADFRKNYSLGTYSISYRGENSNYYRFWIMSRTWNDTQISIEAPTRAEIEDVFYVFDKDWENFRIAKAEEEMLSDEENKPVIFIGHGRSTQWRDLKDHLVDKHSYRVVAYETGARAGHTIRDILDELMAESAMAFLVLTGEDELKDGIIYARPNVIHETGLFQGKLGFSRAIVLLEDGTNEFSNLYGIQQIRYSKNNIKETFGEILATIKREFQ